MSDKSFQGYFNSFQLSSQKSYSSLPLSCKCLSIKVLHTLTRHYLSNIIFDDQLLPICPGPFLVLTLKSTTSWDCPGFKTEGSIFQESLQSLAKTVGHLLLIMYLWVQSRWTFLSYCFFFLIGYYLCYPVFLKCPLLRHSSSPSSSKKLPLPTPTNPKHPLKGISIVLPYITFPPAYLTFFLLFLTCW